MSEYNEKEERNPEEISPKSLLEELLREGARKMLQSAIENEVEEYIVKNQFKRDERGHRLAVRNGSLPEREIMTGLGPIRVKQPRVDDRKLRRGNGAESFTSRILPPYLRRIPSIDNLVPALYLRGISTGDFPQALSAILGEQAKGLSATNIVRLKARWEQEYKEWSKRDLSEKTYVYFWVDGVYFNVRLDDERVCVLVIMAADEEGRKELLAVSDGYRESKLSWKELFQSMQSKAKSHIHDMYEAESKEAALKAYEHFIDVYEAKFPKAVECLRKDKDVLFTFYEFPSSHWTHIRTINPIESMFATVRLRTRRTKGCGSRTATMTMVFKLAKEAQKRWKRLKGYKMIPLVLQEKIFIDGELKEETSPADQHYTEAAAL